MLLDTVVKKDFSDQVTFEQRPGENKLAMWISGRGTVQAKGIASVRALRWEHA